MTLAVFQTTVQNAAGDAIPSAQVTVRLGSSSGALASLFSDSAGTTPITNPFNANANGFARCFTAPGVYWISITGGGSTQVLERVVLAGDAASRNVLGTVSQSGGLPTGAIIQRGSNANGEFVRFADGTQICTYKRSTTLTPQTALGALFTTDLEPMGDFAAPFASSSMPHVQLTARADRGALYLRAPVGVTSNGVGSWMGISPEQGLPLILEIGYIAIGRWF